MNLSVQAMTVLPFPQDHRHRLRMLMPGLNAKFRPSSVSTDKYYPLPRFDVPKSNVSLTGMSDYFVEPKLSGRTEQCCKAKTREFQLRSGFFYVQYMVPISHPWHRPFHPPLSYSCS